MGEAAGVATNSKGHIFVYTRTGAAHATLGTSRTSTRQRLAAVRVRSDRQVTSARSAQGVYGFNFAQAVRVDPQDNIWVVDRGIEQVIKFDPDGRIQLVTEPQAEAIAVRAARRRRRRPRRRSTRRRGGRRRRPRRRSERRLHRRRTGRRRLAAGGGRGPAGPPGAGMPGDSFNRTADVAWDAQGNIYVADGLMASATRASRSSTRTARSSSRGDPRGTEPGQFNSLRGIAIDAKGTVYVGRRRQQADPGVRRRRHLQGADRRMSALPRRSASRPGAHQYLYISNSNDAESTRQRRDLQDGARRQNRRQVRPPGKLVKEFGMVNAIDCRSENELLVGELANWRVQKISLHPAK